MKRDNILHNFLNPLVDSSFNNGFSSRYFSEDPFFVSFSIFFEPDCPLLNPAKNTQRESAERYFLNLDDDIRAGYVVELRERLLDLIKNHQYFISSVSGLNTFYTKDFEEDISLTFTTIESLDLRIAKIKELYNKISYDYKNKRNILPENLTWMDMRINIHDGRKISKWIDNKFVDISPSIDTMSFVLKNTSLITSGGHSFLEEVSNTELELAENELTFEGGNGYFEEDRLSIGKILNNVKGKINSINTTNRDSSLEFNKPSSVKEIPVHKESLLEQLKRAANRTMDRGKRALRIDEYQRLLEEQTLESFGQQIRDGVIRTATDRINEVIDRASIQSGSRSTSSSTNRILNGEDVFQVLKDMASSGELTFDRNPELEKKVLETESLQQLEPSDQKILFQKILEMSKSL